MKNWTEIGDLSFTNGGQTAVVLLSCVLTNTSVAGKISVRGKWPSAAVDVRKRWNSVTLESFEFTVGAKKKSPEGYQSYVWYGAVWKHPKMSRPYIASHYGCTLHWLSCIASLNSGDDRAKHRSSGHPRSSWCNSRTCVSGDWHFIEPLVQMCYVIELTFCWLWAVSTEKYIAMPIPQSTTV